MLARWFVRSLGRTEITPLCSIGHRPLRIRCPKGGRKDLDQKRRDEVERDKDRKRKEGGSKEKKREVGGAQAEVVLKKDKRKRMEGMSDEEGRRDEEMKKRKRMGGRSVEGRKTRKERKEGRSKQRRHFL